MPEDHTFTLSSASAARLRDLIKNNAIPLVTDEDDHIGLVNLCEALDAADRVTILIGDEAHNADAS